MKPEIKRYAAFCIERLKRLPSWLGRMGEPVSKWGPTMTLIVGGLWAYYQFVVAGASDWAINLSVSTEVIPYHDDLALLVVHVRSKNPRSSEVDVEPPDGKFRLTIRELPKAKQKGSIIDPDDPADAHAFTKTIDLLPKDGYVFAPGADFEDATSVVLPLGTKVWVSARLDFSGDYVSTSDIAIVEPQANASSAASTAIRAAR
ncbi:hypothetical protein WS63_11470 [Burkholderia stagnalis]|nr:hypothetical protein WS63_11470 [Burkholderia stagnalis]